MKINAARAVYVILASCVLATCLPIGLSQSVDQPNSKLSTLTESSSVFKNHLFVEMFDYAQLSPRTRLRVEQVTSGIFARAGVSLFWIDCIAVGEKLQQDPECAAPLGPAVLQVRILFRIGDLKNMPSTAGAGYTVGHMTTVSLEKAKAVSASGLGPMADFLGCIIAHELGHILLGPNSHSVSGMMRARWDTKELQAAAQRSLLFSPQEAARIRAQLTARAGPPTAGAIARATPPGKLGEIPPANRRSAPDVEVRHDQR